jgi:5-methylcytosine-specific restriction endonuclease McrA
MFLINLKKKKYCAHLEKNGLTLCKVENGTYHPLTLSSNSDNRPICQLCVQLLKKSEDKNKAKASKCKVYSKSEVEKVNFYKTQEWRELRFLAFEKYGRKCLCCNSTNSVLHVDHVKPMSLYPHLKLDINNLQILCEDCNIGKSNRFETDFRRMNE